MFLLGPDSATDIDAVLETPPHCKLAQSQKIGTKTDDAFVCASTKVTCKHLACVPGVTY